MRLIFAYIENFKNIKKQSFNFDSKYKCKYDYENKILEIEKNEHNIKIFSENIVFNAIVGQNGSGKTSLIEFLILMFHNSENYKENLEGFVLLEKNEKIYISYYGNENIAFKEIKSSTMDIDNFIGTYDEISYYFKNQISKKYFRNIFYNPSPELISSSFLKYTYKELQPLDAAIYDFDFKPLDNINTIAFPFKKNGIYNIVYSERISIIMMFKIANLIEQEKIKNLISSKIFFIPSKVIIGINKETLKETLIKSYVNNKKLEEYFNNIDSNRISIVDLFRLMLLGVISTSHVMNNEYSQYFFKKNSKIDSFLNGIYSECKKNISSYLTVENIMEYLLNNVENIELEQILKNLSLLIQELRDSFDSTLNIDISSLAKLIDFLVENKYEYLPLKLNSNETDSDFIVSFLKHIPLRGFDVKVYDENNILYNDFSFGEKSIISIFSIILYFTLFLDSKYINIFIDEMEIGLNPEWQRKLIKILFEEFRDVIKNKDIYINFIIATHSPFILSDIPKDDIVFLEKGKNVNKFRKDDNTFGANIYDIFEKGFFLENSIGKYSEEMIKAIDLILSFYNGLKLAKEGNIFILRKLLGIWYSSRKGQITDTIQKQQDEKFLKIIERYSKKCLKKLFLRNNLDFNYYEKLFFKNGKISFKIENYIKIIGDEVIRNHLMNLYKSLKNES